MAFIDLRSDTVTQPTPQMREAMATAAVGDDVYMEDPTINALQEKAAYMLGKEAALFVPSGTMGNLAAILAHCRRGDEVIVGDISHTFLFEAGGMAAVGGIQPHTVRNQPDGTLDLEEVQAAIRPDDPHHPRTTLICLENTHNRCRGAVLTVEYGRQMELLAGKHNLRLHLDGARLFNAAAALGVPASELAAPFDSLTFCLSKGLSAPVGSLIAGSAAFIRETHRARKLLGGGMRQAGILAAAGIVALDTMVDRLKEDHNRAVLLAGKMSGLAGVTVENPIPASNMVYITLDREVPLDDSAFLAGLAARNIKISRVGRRRYRLVTHYWIGDAEIETAVAGIQATLAAV